jgi:hypothetical protein
MAVRVVVALGALLVMQGGAMVASSAADPDVRAVAVAGQMTVAERTVLTTGVMPLPLGDPAAFKFYQ